MIAYELVRDGTTDTFLAAFSACATRVFERFDRESAAWRLSKMPEVTVFTAMDGDKMVGFKAGYAATENRYYSWLGGLDPDYRRQGIARELMDRQHNWVQAEGYELVETHVLQANTAMVQLNLAAGLQITGMFDKRGESNFIMQRRFS